MNRNQLYTVAKHSNGDKRWPLTCQVGDDFIITDGMILEVNPEGVSAHFAAKLLDMGVNGPAVDRIISATYDFTAKFTGNREYIQRTEEDDTFNRADKSALDFVDFKGRPLPTTHIADKYYDALCKEYGHDVHRDEGELSPVAWFVDGKCRAIAMPFNKP